MSRGWDYHDHDHPESSYGSADLSGSDAGSDQPAGVLWVPDPEQRRGWREVYVDKPSAKAKRGYGFRKPGAR